MDPVEVTVTCPTPESAGALMRVAVEARLAACAQTWPITSCYRWEGEVVEDPEHLVLFKTTAEHFDALAALIVEHHEYDLPAIVALPLDATGPGYTEWLTASLDPTEGT